MRLYKIEALFQKDERTRQSYYVYGKSARDARRRFKGFLPAFTAAGVEEVNDATVEELVKENPQKYLLLGSIAYDNTEVE